MLNQISLVHRIFFLLLLTIIFFMCPYAYVVTYSTGLGLFFLLILIILIFIFLKIPYFDIILIFSYVMYQNIILSIFSETKNLTIALGTNVLIIFVLALKKFGNCYHAIEKKEKKNLFIFFIICIIYTLIGCCKNGVVMSIIYARLFTIPIILLFLGRYSNFKINNCVNIFILCSSIMIFAGFIQIFFPSSFIKISNYLNYYHLTEKVLFDSPEKLINTKSKILFNTNLFTNTIRQFRIFSTTLNIIGYGYLTSLLCLFFHKKKNFILFILNVILLFFIGSKGPVLVLSFTLITQFVNKFTNKNSVLFFLVFYTSLLFYLGIKEGNNHVLGFLFGITNLINNPLGLGFGFGGNMTFSLLNSGDKRELLTGSESAFGVLFTQTGLSSFVIVFIYIKSIVFSNKDKMSMLTIYALFNFVNGIFQEEAFSIYSLGITLFFLGVEQSKGGLYEVKKSKNEI